jgi:short chain dehydrogenase
MFHEVLVATMNVPIYRLGGGAHRRVVAAVNDRSGDAHTPPSQVRWAATDSIAFLYHGQSTREFDVPIAQVRILIIGGSSGMGLAIAQRLAKAGAEVFIAGRDRAKLDRSVASLEGPAAGLARGLGSTSERDRARIPDQRRALLNWCSSTKTACASNRCGRPGLPTTRLQWRRSRRKARRGWLRLRHRRAGWTVAHEDAPHRSRAAGRRHTRRVYLGRS